MLFSTNTHGISLYSQTYYHSFVTPEFLNTIIWVLPMFALATAVGLILWSEINQKAAETKVNNE